MTTVEKIKTIMNRRNMNITSLADETEQTRQNLTNKFKRNNLNENEIRNIADALNCDIEINFIDRDTGEIIP